MNELKVALKLAESGRQIIDSHTKKEAINQVFVIFPDDDPDLLAVAFRHLDRLMQEADFTTILTSIDLKGIYTYLSRPYEIVKLDMEEMNGLLRFASMAQIDVPSIKIVSLRMPRSQRGELLPGYKDISMDVAVVRGLYGIFGEYT